MAREDDLRTIERFLEKENTPPPAGYGTPTPPAPDLTKEEIRKGELIKKRTEEESNPALDPDKLPDGEQVAQNFKASVKDVKFRLEKLPSPGGIIFPLLVLMVFFFAIVPVAGKTRLAWIWAVLTGSAELPLGGVTITGGSTVSSPKRGGSSSKKGSSSSSSNSNSNKSAGQNGKGGDASEILSTGYSGYSHLLGSEFE